MSHIRHLALALLGLVAVGCGDQAGGITGPAPEPALGVSGQRGFRGAVELAAGDAQVGVDNVHDQYSFLATRDKRGTVAGTFVWASRRPDGIVYRGSGRVTCLSVVGNVALIGGTIEQTDAWWITPDRLFAIWSVQDNGNKKKSPPDLASVIAIAVTEAQVEHHCVNGFLAMNPNERGEIVVRSRVTGTDDDSDSEDDSDSDAES